MIGGIIQARMGSTRLPEKVLLPLPYNSNTTELEQVIKRVKESEQIDKVIVATSKKENDDPIERIAKKNQVKTFRGSEKDVLSRYYNCAKKFELKQIVRITGDCPCIDPNVIDTIIKKHLEEKPDYTSNTLERTFPRGQDVEIFNYQTLKKTHREAKKQPEREHVTTYIRKNRNNKFKTNNVKALKDQIINIKHNDRKKFLTIEENKDIRITLDTEADYTLLATIFEYLYSKDHLFDLKDIIELLEEKPWLNLMNQNVKQKKVYESLEEEINDAIELLESQDMANAAEILKEH